MTNKPLSSYLLPLIIIGFLFFIFGFCTWVNGSLIPYFKIACELNEFQSYLVATAFYLAYFFMAIPSSYILERVGFKTGMIVGLLVMATGAFLFIPAAHTRNHAIFLLALFIIGTGLALLQTATNPYISIIGPIESAAQRISIMGVFNKVGGKIAILIFGAVALKDADKFIDSLDGLSEAAKAIKLDELITRVITPYTIMGIILILVAIVLYFLKLPKVEDDIENTEYIKDRGSVFKYPYVFFAALAIFFYVGAEVIAGDTIASFGKNMGIRLDTSKYYTILTLACMLIGYFIGIVCIPLLISQESALKFSAILGIILTIFILFAPNQLAVYLVASLGLANAVMWPAIFPLGIEKLGKYTKIGSALLIMGIVGGAILTPIYGMFADTKSSDLAIIASKSQLAYWILLPCYVYILWFAISGHKIGKDSN